MKTRRQLEAELDLLEGYGFIYDWHPNTNGKYLVELGLPDSDAVEEWTLSQVRVFLRTMKYVRNYPMTIHEATTNEARWR